MQIEIWGQKFDYEGEIDEEGEACGVGVATVVPGEITETYVTEYRGTFRQNLPFGIVVNEEGAVGKTRIFAGEIGADGKWGRAT